MKLADEMRELFARWKSSNLSLMAFGKAEGVPYRKLMYWRRKLGHDARRESTEMNSSSKVHFAPLRLVPDSQSVELHSEKFGVVRVPCFNWMTRPSSVAVQKDPAIFKRICGSLQTRK